jgi:hypothetical protein
MQQILCMIELLSRWRIPSGDECDILNKLVPWRDSGIQIQK